MSEHALCALSTPTQCWFSSDSPVPSRESTLGPFQPLNRRILASVSNDYYRNTPYDGIRSKHGGEFGALVPQRFAVTR